MLCVLVDSVEDTGRVEESKDKLAGEFPRAPLVLWSLMNILF